MHCTPGPHGTHSFDGACAPGSGGSRWSFFSVGLFEWVPRAGGDGVKRGRAKVRITGSTDRPERVYAKAREICALLDAGTYPGPKNIRV